MLLTIFLAYFISSFREICCLLYQQQYTVSRPTKTIKFRNPLDVVSPRLVCTSNGIFHKSSFRYCTSDANSHQNESEQEEPHQPLKNNQRRSFLISIAAPLAATTLAGQSQEPAFARGLVQFPCKKEKLQNTYHFMRSGQSLLEERDILSTNPLFLTNRENALSDLGIEQVEEACRYIKAQEGTPTIVGYSLAANCVDSAAVVGKELRLGQNRLVPEFTFLDPRAVGKWDILPLQTTEEAIWAMDTTEAGDYGSDGRPPPNDDGTPNETLGDQVIRLRQYFSVLESFYSGDTILVIFPDGTGPALLTCLIGGIPLKRVHELNFQPGEIRLDVNYDSARSLLPSEPSKEYAAIVERGLNQLKMLRENPESIINVKDQAYELERMEQINKERAITKARKEKEEAELKAQKDTLQTVGKNEVGTFSTMSQGLIISCLSAFGIASVVTAISGLRETATDRPSLQLGEGKEGSEIYGKEVANNGTGIVENVNGSSPEGIVSANISDPLEERLERLYSNNAESNGTVSPLETSPEERAQKAMEAYLEEDDGGGAWLNLISGIIQEEKET